MSSSRNCLRFGCISLIAAVGFCARGNATPLEVVLVPKPGVASTAEVALALKKEQGGLAPVHRQVPITAPAQAFQLEEGVWKVEAAAFGIWAPERQVTLKGDAVRRIEVELYEATAIRGKVAVERGEPLPKEVGIELYLPIDKLGPGNPLRRRAPAEALAFRCPVFEGEFRCIAPAGNWDVRVRAADHVSHYLWNVAFPRTGATELGTFALRRGASIVGWVMAEGPVKPGAEWRLALAPMQAAAAASAEDTQRVFSASTGTDERGFFHFMGISPGTYVLTAGLEGFAPAKFFPLRVLENRESQLEEVLVVHPPASVDVQVTPAADLLQRPWRIKVFDLGETPGTMEFVAEGTAGEDGRWRAAELAPGRFLVRLEDADGSPWGFQEIEVAAGSADVSFELDLVEVEGELRLGGEPLAATLYFGGKRGVPRFRLEADETGSFSGHVAREGNWRVDIEAPNPSVHRSLSSVEVKRGGQHVARVTIDLPDGALRGRVVDEKDQPVAEANVMLSIAGEAPVVARSGAEGNFDLRGLGKGYAFIQASTRDMESEAVMLQLQETNAPVRLVLEQKRELTGVVLGSYGGIPGAQVIAVAPGEIRTKGVTDAAGKFTLRIPASAAYLNLLVLPPGHALQARRVFLKDEAALQIYVEPEGGTLILEGATVNLAESQSTIGVTQNGVPLDSVSVRHWVEANGRKPVSGDPDVVPQMAAGRYEVCRVPLSQLRARLQGLPVGDCVAGTLVPGGELTLRVPGKRTAK